MNSASTARHPRNVLICSTAAEGHVNPALPIARSLVQSGHTVRWYTGRSHRYAVEAAGAHFEPMVDATDPAETPFASAFPERDQLEGLAALRFDLKHVFLDNVPGQVRDLQRILAHFPADVLLVDTAFTAASMLHELGGPPFASYGISVLPIASRDIAPVGTGRPPGTSTFGRFRDRMLSSASPWLLFRDVQRHHQLVRKQLRLAPTTSTVFDTFVSPYVYMQASTESFEYPRTDLPPQVHFIGPLLPDPPATFDAPSWWSQLDGSRPVVLVNQGTIAVDLGDLIRPTLEALRSENVVVIATGGRGADGLAMSVPPNAHVEAFVPFGPLMKRVDVMVTNGGYGGVQFALANGVPLIVAGTTEEKPEIAARVEWSGAGINLRTRRPTPEQIRDAVWTLLHDERFRHNARRIQHDTEKYDAPLLATQLLEELAASGRPVHRKRSQPRRLVNAR